MKLLALDTATEMCSVALHDGSGWRVREELAGNRHSELLLPMVRAILAEAGLSLAQLDGLAYGRGPGSFTGLRIGCGVAQGLAFGASLPVVGVVTLEAMAWQAGGAQVVACIDARMNEVYVAAYRRAAKGVVEVIAPRVCKPDAVPDLPAGMGPWQGVGTGFAAYGETLRVRLDASLGEVNAALYPTARAIGELALPRFVAGEALPAERIEPLYIRDRVAKTIQERAAAGMAK